MAATSVFDDVRSEGPAAPPDAPPSGSPVPSVFSEVRNATKPSVVSPSQPLDNSWLGAARGVGDAALTMGSGALHGINNAIADLMPDFGNKKSTEDLKSEIANDPILNYQPKTPEGEYLMGHIRRLTGPISDTLSAAHDVLERSFGKRTADVMGDIATLATARLGGSKVEVDAAAAPIQEGHALTEAAKTEATRLGGFKQRAEQIGLKLPEGGTPDEHSVAALGNRPLVNDVARQDLRLPKNSPLTPDMMDAARDTYVSPAYKAIESLKEPVPLGDEFRTSINDLVKTTRGEFSPKLVPPQGSEISGADAVEYSKSARYRARVLDRRAAQGDPEAAADAQLYRRSAEAVEDAVQSHLESSGQGALSKAWDDARVYAAKSHSYEDALDGAGNVQASNLKKQLFTKKKPLAGDQEMLANLAAQYPEAFRTTRVTQPQAGIIRRSAAEAAPIVGGTAGAWAGGPLGAAAGAAIGKGVGSKILKGK